MPISGPDILLYEKKDKVVVITLNRPDRMNAIGEGIFDRLEKALDRFEGDDDAWVAIITGTGDRAFCVGADSHEAQARYEKCVRLPQNFKRYISKPLIAAINGYCLGGGWSLAQKCAVRIAAEHAQLGIPEAKWGFRSPFICELPRLMHLGHALEIAIWGDGWISAQREKQASSKAFSVPSSTKPAKKILQYQASVIFRVYEEHRDSRLRANLLAKCSVQAL